jgi:hypothetical protein
VTQQQVHFRVFLNSFAFPKGIVHLIPRVDEFDEFDDFDDFNNFIDEIE